MTSADEAQPIVVDTLLVPPGGWRYIQLESDFSFHTISLADIKKQIYSHRKANGFDLEEGWWEQVQLEMCVDLNILETHCGAAPPTSEPPDPLRIRLYDLLQFFRTMREWVIKHGFKKNSAEESNYRANICSTCEFNREIKGCLGCAGIVRWLSELLGRPRPTTDFDDKLDNCAKCKCVLKFKVHAPLAALTDSTPDLDQYPDHCWMVKKEETVA